MLILAISRLVTVIKEKTVETAKTVATAEINETAGNTKASKVGKDDGYLETNLLWVLYIWYLIIF